MGEIELRTVLSACPDGVTLRVKIVPAASRTKLLGVLGDRLKVTVAAPPEGGRANQALCAFFASLFDLPRHDVIVAAGKTRPQKVVELLGLNLCEATQKLRALLADRR